MTFLVTYDPSAAALVHSKLFDSNDVGADMLKNKSIEQDLSIASWFQCVEQTVQRTPEKR